MTDVDSILDNATQWVTESVTKPTIKTGQLHATQMMTRGIVVRRVSRDDQLVGVIDRSRYSVDSHEIWICRAVSSTSEDDIDNILKVIKRICAEYTQVSGEETYLNWESQDIKNFNNKRFEATFAIVRFLSVQLGF